MIALCARRSGRTRRGRRRPSYWVPEGMRSNRKVESVVLRCAVCGDLAEHGLLRGKPRASCRGCQKAYLRAWREGNWQRVKLRNTHRGMVDRCHNPERMKKWARASGIAGAWRDYGAEGVTVCDRWRDPETGFENFCADVGLPPSREETLDRVDSTRGYEPSNCRWASKMVQDANRKNSIFLGAIDPETGVFVSLTIAEWSRRRGIPRKTISRRLARGLSADDALGLGVPF